MTRMLEQVIRKPWRIVGLGCLAMGLYAAVLRFTQGLGASTNLSDEFPWGLWVGFDVVTGVGLAAGGFTISALVYILRIEKYKPLARPAVLTAFIGYLLVIGGLMFDLGHPWRIWHPMIMWNPHSVMFEVAWCVTLYTLVLASEASALIFERLRWARATKIAHRATFPLTIFAVLLSMLHQSSLGSLFLLVPGRLHEFWYSPLLPFLFFLSAVSIGLVMTIIESNLSARAFKRPLENEVLRDIAKLAAVVMSIYLVARFSDMARAGVLFELWPISRAGFLLVLELMLGFILPAILFSTESVVRNRRLLNRTAQLALLGFILNRVNVTITGFEVVSGRSYSPALTEVAVTLMIITIGVTAFYLAGKHLPVFEADELAQERQRVWKAEIDRQAGYGFVVSPVLGGAKGGAS